MPPMDIKDWWLAAAAATSIMAQHADTATLSGDRIGVATSARQTVKNVSGDRVVYVGNDIQFGERLTTDGTGALHILFMDQSSITLGPNSALTIDEFVFHPEKQEGHIKVNLLKGALRVVGGLISKYSDTQVVTSNGTIGIRGGITIAEADENQAQAIFLFGQHMNMTSPNGLHSQTVTRPGFGLTSGHQGLSHPIWINVDQFADLLNRFESHISLVSTGEAFTPAGQLVSTGDQPLGGNAPDTLLALDHLDKVLNDINARDPRSALKKHLGTGVNPIQS